MSALRHRTSFLVGTLALLLSACIPLSGGRVYARKQVAVVVDTTFIVAKDASTCWRQARRPPGVGELLWCAWQEPRSRRASPQD